MKCIAWYVVTEKKTGEIVVQGHADKCAAHFGIAYHSFLTMANRAIHGKGKYHVERTDEEPWKKTCAMNWDAAFGWYKEDLEKYPCDGCMRRASCEFTDTYCPRWAAWYRAAHDAAAARLKARGGGG